MSSNVTKDSDNHYTLSDIIRGLLYSVNTSQEVLEQQYSKTLKKYFGQDGKPITTKIMIDCERYMEVPLIALINPSAIALQEMDLEMSLHVDEVLLKQMENCGYEKDLTRGSFKVSINPANKCPDRPPDMMDIYMKFRAIDPPEGFSRIMDEIIKQIHPESNNNREE